MSRLGTGLSIELKQTQKLSPAQLQTIEILQMSSVELEGRIQNELMENPVLEIADSQYDSHEYGESFRLSVDEHSERLAGREDAYDDHDYWDRSFARENGYTSYGGDGSGGIADFEKFYRTEETLAEHLMKQLAGSNCPAESRKAALYIIYSLGSDGYLDADLEEIAEASGSGYENAAAALDVIQSLDPAGVGARSLEECLCLQIDPDDGLGELTKAAIRSYLHEVASGRHDVIARKLKTDQDTAREIIARIKRLDPRPGSQYSDGSSVQYITPDVIVSIAGDEIRISLAGDQPQLTISSYYAELSRTSQDPEVTGYLKERMDKASRLISNIEQRGGTIMSVTRAILEHQKQFMEPGNKILTPLTMQEIAEELGINVSTVSRAVSGKYLHCPGGTYPLRYFFTAEVAGTSRDSILDRIRELIDGEDKARPLSDQKIADLLASESTDISRRTVAKYRDQAGILPASMRRVR